MTQDQNKYVVRFPDGLRDEIKGAAARNSRSMNAEIVHRLKRTLVDDAPRPPITQGSLGQGVIDATIQLFTKKASH